MSPSVVGPALAFLGALVALASAAALWARSRAHRGALADFTERVASRATRRRRYAPGPTVWTFGAPPEIVERLALDVGAVDALAAGRAEEGPNERDRPWPSRLLASGAAPEIAAAVLRDHLGEAAFLCLCAGALSVRPQVWGALVTGLRAGARLSLAEATRLLTLPFWSLERWPDGLQRALTARLPDAASARRGWLELLTGAGVEPTRRGSIAWLEWRLDALAQRLALGMVVPEGELAEVLDSPLGRDAERVLVAHPEALASAGPKEPRWDASRASTLRWGCVLGAGLLIAGAVVLAVGSPPPPVHESVIRDAGRPPPLPIDSSAVDATDATDAITVTDVTDATNVTDTINVIVCREGRRDCDGDPSNGCEVNLRNNRRHCGRCDRVCPAERVCDGGECVPPPCPEGQTRCDAGCFATASDPSHCGACDTACATYPHATPVCAAGRCAVSCETDWATCAASTPMPASHGFPVASLVSAVPCSTYTLTSVAHCGRCGNQCASGQVCARGACMDRPGITLRVADNTSTADARGLERSAVTVVYRCSAVSPRVREPEQRLLMQGLREYPVRCRENFVIIRTETGANTIGLDCSPRTPTRRAVCSLHVIIT